MKISVKEALSESASFLKRNLKHLAGISIIGCIFSALILLIRYTPVITEKNPLLFLALGKETVRGHTNFKTEPPTQKRHAEQIGNGVFSFLRGCAGILRGETAGESKGGTPLAHTLRSKV